MAKHKWKVFPGVGERCEWCGMLIEDQRSKDPCLHAPVEEQQKVAEEKEQKVEEDNDDDEVLGAVVGVLGGLEALGTGSAPDTPVADNTEMFKGGESGGGGGGAEIAPDSSDAGSSDVDSSDSSSTTE